MPDGGVQNKGINMSTEPFPELTVDQIRCHLREAVAQAAADAKAAAAAHDAGMSPQRRATSPKRKGTRHFDRTVPAFKQSSADVYLKQAIALAEKCGHAGDTAISQLLLHTDDAVAKVEEWASGSSDWAMSTLQTHVSRLLGIVKHCHWEIGEERLTRWRDMLAELAAKSAESPQKKQRSAKLLDNWVTVADLKAKYDELQADPIKRHSDAALLLAFHCFMLPLRGGDLGTVQVRCGCAGDCDVRNAEGERVNCIVLHCSSMGEDATGAHLALADYKVARSHGTAIIPIPAPLVAILQASLRRRPREHVFVGRDGKPRSRIAHSNYAIGVMSRLLGARVNTTLLRHVAASDINYNEIDVADLEKHASAMCTSSDMLFKTYRLAGAHKRPRSPVRATARKRRAADTESEFCDSASEPTTAATEPLGRESASAVPDEPALAAAAAALICLSTGT